MLRTIERLVICEIWELVSLENAPVSEVKKRELNKTLLNLRKEAQADEQNRKRIRYDFLGAKTVIAVALLLYLPF